MKRWSRRSGDQRADSSPASNLCCNFAQVLSIIWDVVLKTWIEVKWGGISTSSQLKTKNCHRDQIKSRGSHEITEWAIFIKLRCILRILWFPQKHKFAVTPSVCAPWLSEPPDRGTKLSQQLRLRRARVECLQARVWLVTAEILGRTERGGTREGKALQRCSQEIAAMCSVFGDRSETQTQSLVLLFVKSLGSYTWRSLRGCV